MVRPPIVRIILSLVAQNRWSLCQLVVSNVFLHGLLKENVFMAQPLGFVDLALPAHVCQLHKSLYVLKQAPRAWFERFTSHLFTLGFTASVADASLFILSHGSVIVSHLSSAFELKDLDHLHYFLGLQIDYKIARFFVHQSKYLTNLFHKFNMTDCKAASTPIATTPILSTTRTDILFDPTSYRSLVGAMQYATFPRP